MNSRDSAFDHTLHVTSTRSWRYCHFLLDKKSPHRKTLHRVIDCDQYTTCMYVPLDLLYSHPSANPEQYSTCNYPPDHGRGPSIEYIQYVYPRSQDGCPHPKPDSSSVRHAHIYAYPFLRLPRTLQRPLIRIIANTLVDTSLSACRQFHPTLPPE